MSKPTNTNTFSDYEISGKIMSVEYAFDAENKSHIDNRLSFVTNQKFITVKPDGTSDETERFSLDLFAASKEFAKHVKPIAMAATFALGKQVNPKIIALALIGADFKARRVYKKAGEQRKYGNSTYANDCFTTEIISVTPHIDDFWLNDLKDMIKHEPAIEKKEIVYNPLGI